MNRWRSIQPPRQRWTACFPFDRTGRLPDEAPNVRGLSRHPLRAERRSPSPVRLLRGEPMLERQAWARQRALHLACRRLHRDRPAAMSAT
jgi:hypothetical protein